MRYWKITRALLVVTIIAAILPSLARNGDLQGQDRVFIAAAAVTTEQDIQRLINHGRELEQAHKWTEALTHYEKALREHPNRKDLKYRLQTARANFDVTRRYKDPSFKALFANKDDNQAYRMYGEVLHKIRTHHVDTPEWRKLLGAGTRALKVALLNEHFVRQHLPRADRNRIRDFAGQLDERLNRYRIASQRDAHAVGAYAGRLAKETLGLSPTATMLEYACGAINSLDPYSAYLSGGQLDDVFSQIEGNFVGLGIELKTTGDHLDVVSVIETGPAYAAGLRAGDKIVGVADKWTKDVSPDVAADMLKGVEGSRVRITYLRSGTSFRADMTRRRIEVPSVDRLQILDKESGVAYMRLASFQKTTDKDFTAAMWKLHHMGMKRLIVDVRGNPGGLLTAAVDVSNRFVDKGTIVSTQGRNPDEDRVHRAIGPGTWRVPLVVLVDGDSASASEIFAGAIRDHRRGVIMGDKSYGKGSVQGIFPLSVWKGGIRLTTAKFYSPNGKPISGIGVTPDVTVHSAKKPNVALTEVTDPVLKAAIAKARSL